MTFQRSSLAALYATAMHTLPGFRALTDDAAMRVALMARGINPAAHGVPDDLLRVGEHDLSGDPAYDTAEPRDPAPRHEPLPNADDAASLPDDVDEPEAGYQALPDDLGPWEG